MGNEEQGKKIMQGVVVVMAVIILVLVSALIIGSFISSTAFQTTLSGSVANNTLSSVTNVSNSTLSIKSTYSNAICSLTSIINTTGGETVASGNYTFYSTACNLILSATTDYNATDLNATYTWTSVQNLIGGVNTTWIGVQFGLFVTALLGFLAVIGVIIAIVWLISYIKPLFSKEDGIQTKNI